MSSSVLIRLLEHSPPVPPDCEPLDSAFALGSSADPRSPLIPGRTLALRSHQFSRLFYVLWAGPASQTPPLHCRVAHLHLHPKLHPKHQPIHALQCPSARSPLPTCHPHPQPVQSPLPSFLHLAGGSAAGHPPDALAWSRCPSRSSQPVWPLRKPLPHHPALSR